jgi:hypothetical protein
MEFEVVKHPDYIPTTKLDPLRRQTVIPALYMGFYGRDIVLSLLRPADALHVSGDYLGRLKEQS